MHANWKREREIRKVLRDLARQRVCGFDKLRNAWIVEHPIPTDNDALRTCHARGWAEPMPHGGIEKGNPLQEGLPLVAAPPQERGRITLHRLTDSGWNAIHRTHDWVVSTFFVALVTLFATVVGIVISVLINQS